MGTFAPPTGTKLSSKTTPIVYTAGAAVLKISVEQLGQAPEDAYQSGAFSPVYSGSTQAGGVYTLRRTGGWLAGFVVHVDEQDAVDDGVVDSSGNTIIDAFGNRVVP